jgi:hypothetical protein
MRRNLASLTLGMRKRVAYFTEWSRTRKLEKGARKVKFQAKFLKRRVIKG